MLSLRRRRSICKPASRIARASFEALEGRRLLTAAVWTGAGTDSNFTDAANWQGGVAPTAGQDVTFPSGVTNTTVTIDSNVSVGTIEFDSAYTVQGSSSLTVNTGELATVGDTTIVAPIVLGASSTSLTTYSLAAITDDGNISDGGNAYGVDVQGNGLYTMAGNGETYTGQTLVDGGVLATVTNLDSNVSLTPGSTYLGGGSTVPTVSSAGGTVAIVNGSDAGYLNVSNNLTLDSTSTLSVDVDDSFMGISSEVTVDAGTINLGGATLTGSAVDGYVPEPGDVITLINNQTGNPITGTFSGLAQGASTTISGQQYVISYTGGTSGQDVTLTASKVTPTVTLSSSHVPVYEGHTVTLTATVTGTDADSDPITGTVTFYDNGTAIGSADTLTNGTYTFDDTTLPVGSNSITAIYSGNSSFATATSSALAATVRANPTGTVPTITSATTSASTHGFTIGATVVGADTSSQGAAGLTYTWTAIHTPAGAKLPTYNANGTNAAGNVIARFYKDGGYILQCTVKNAAGNSVTTDVSVTVSQKATSIKIEPHGIHIAKDGTEQYTATVLDQFNHALRTNPTITYAVAAGPGSINSAGLYTASSMTGGVTIEAEADDLTAVAGAVVS
jgi:fibronectin-binding autotransporter adhesin